MITRSILAVTMLTLAACAGDGPSPGDQGTGVRAGRQQETALQAQEQRALARALRDMAERRRVEADLLAREHGPDSPTVERKRQLAQDLQEAASEAEDRARTLGRQVPHGMVQ